MRAGLIDRREFMAAAGVGFAAALLPGRAAALARADAVYGSAFMDRQGEYGLAILSDAGDIVSRLAMPGRCHGLASGNGLNVVFARRPGNFAIAFDAAAARPPVAFATVAGRHFYGHGAFSGDGRLLYAAENDFDSGVGIIGIYDATDGFRRLGEYPSHGIGPHEILMMGDGRTLIVANGGIQTHPDFGKVKLNLGAMEPSIALIDAATGSLKEKHLLPPSLSRLSLRHVALDAKGRAWIGSQYEGEQAERPPLVAIASPGEALSFPAIGEAANAALANYVGAVAASRDGTRLAFSSPVGGALVIVDAASGKAVETQRWPAVCGIAGSVADGFVASGETGQFGASRHDLAWDNHIAVLA